MVFRLVKPLLDCHTSGIAVTKRLKLSQSFAAAAYSLC